jgi:hypothetical protein
MTDSIAQANNLNLSTQKQHLDGDASSLVPKPVTRTFPLAFGRAIADRSTLDILRQVHEIRLPKNWSALKDWKAQKEQEIQRILEDEGETAFLDLRAGTKDPFARGKLLKRGLRHGDEVIELTSEAEKALKIRKGLGVGFRYFDESTGEEYFTRLLQVRNGYLEVGFSWHGAAGPLVEGWVQLLRNRCDEMRWQSRQKILFDDLDRDRQQMIQRLLRYVQVLEDGRRIMEAAIGQFSRQAQNPVNIPAEAFRVLLGLEKDPNWKPRVEGGLQALRACTFRINSFDMQKIKGYGAFLGAWLYQGAGQGAHGDGYYLLWVQPTFLGCLAIFESGKSRLASGHEATNYLFGRKPAAQSLKALGWGSHPKGCEKQHIRSSFSQFDAGSVFFNAAEGFSPKRQNLVALLERELTLQKDPVSRTLGNPILRIAEKAKYGDHDANKARLYNQNFCPLLKPGVRYNSALGHFRRNPESGRTLYGSRMHTSAAGRVYSGGLISELGYHLPAGAAYQKRRNIVRQALEDLKAIIVEYCNGVVAALIPGTGWLTLDQAAALHEDVLCKRARFFLFVPETWQKDRVRRWESQMEDRAKTDRGQYAWKVTDDPNRTRNGCSAFEDSSGIPLRCRLKTVRSERGYNLSKLADLFGVCKQALSAWEAGPDPDNNGKVHGKQIPTGFIPLIEQWILTNQAPTPAELNNRKNSRAKHNETIIKKDIAGQSTTSRSFNYAFCPPRTQQNETLSTSRSTNQAQLDFEINQPSRADSAGYEDESEGPNAS